MAEEKPRFTSIQPTDSARKVYYRLGGLSVAFVSGGISVFAFRYLFSGRSLQLSPDVFISLVFTIAIGAASLVLALLAINYGRVSERVITERADRSIEIQMSLFEKSLDLQTRLFDKTTSTLETIGRSTGVTEQRLGDMLGMFQNPAFTKQIAGRAVEETATELQKKGKEGAIDAQTETQLAERLTQNIVRELSARFAGFETQPRPQQTEPQRDAPEPTTSQSIEELRTQFARAMKSEEAKKAFRARVEFVMNAVRAIPEAKIELSEEDYWDYVVIYKGKKIALDIRNQRPRIPFSQTYDESIKGLVKQSVDCLLFVFRPPVQQKFADEFEARNNVVNNRLRYIAVDDDSSLQNELVANFESVAAALPSA